MLQKSRQIDMFKDDALFRPGDTAQHAYLLIEGRVDREQTTPKNTNRRFPIKKGISLTPFTSY